MSTSLLTKQSVDEGGVCCGDLIKLILISSRLISIEEKQPYLGDFVDKNVKSACVWILTN